MSTFAKILDLCQGIGNNLPGVVFIGGVAVYLHAMRRASRMISLETSHDADFMISFPDYGTLKDMEEIVPSPRLAKHQMIVDGVEFDVYVERLNQLVVPYDEVFAHAAAIAYGNGEVKVACLEHLLVLKLEAFQSRGHSSKGEKDRRDVAKLGLLLGRKTRMRLVAPYLRDDLIVLLGQIAKSTVFLDLCSHNAHEAKKLRAGFSTFVANVSAVA